MSRRSIIETIFSHIDGHRFDAGLAAFQPDAEIRLPGAPPVTPREFLGMLHGWYEAFPDLRHTLVDYTEAGDRVAYELRVEGTHRGAMPTPGGPLAATGRRVTLEACDFVVFAGDRVKSWHVYFDNVALLAQLGALPAK